MWYLLTQLFPLEHFRCAETPTKKWNISFWARSLRSDACHSAVKSKPFPSSLQLSHHCVKRRVVLTPARGCLPWEACRQEALNCLSTSMSRYVTHWANTQPYLWSKDIFLEWPMTEEVSGTPAKVGSWVLTWWHCGRSGSPSAVLKCFGISQFTLFFSFFHFPFNKGMIRAQWPDPEHNNISSCWPFLRPLPITADLCWTKSCLSITPWDSSWLATRLLRPKVPTGAWALLMDRAAQGMVAAGTGWCWLSRTFGRTFGTGYGNICMLLHYRMSVGHVPWFLKSL